MSQALITPSTIRSYNQPNSYAHQKNSQYNNSKSFYLDLKNRFNQTLLSYPNNTQAWFRSQLSYAIKTFQARFPQYKKFSDMPLCLARQATLDQILIDITMQRQLELTWPTKIITDFRPSQVQAIKVYQVVGDEINNRYHNNKNTYYASWDGQHTAIVLWILATMVFNENPADVVVPIVIHDVKSKAEIRENFVNCNTERGNKLLDPIDICQQQIYGVRIDGCKEPDWVQVELKQKHLEDAGLFLTDQKFGDTDQIGAISRVEDIMNPKFSAEQVRQFCVYAQHVLGFVPRAINTKEAPIILGFLKMAANDNITYTDDEIVSLAALCMDLFQADFDARGVFWQRAENAYLNWWNQNHGSQNWANSPSRPRFNKDWTNGGTFFWYQLAKRWQDHNQKPMRLPKLNISSGFLPSKKDLF